MTAPVIARVTVVRVMKEPLKVQLDESVRQFTMVGVARVEQVIKGEIARRTIKVVSEGEGSSCGPHFSTGVSGVVAGTLRYDLKNKPVLYLAAESLYQREKRLKDLQRR